MFALTHGCWGLSPQAYILHSPAHLTGVRGLPVLTDFIFGGEHSATCLFCPPRHENLPCTARLIHTSKLRISLEHLQRRFISGSHASGQRQNCQPFRGTKVPWSVVWYVCNQYMYWLYGCSSVSHYLKPAGPAKASQISEQTGFLQTVMDIKSLCGQILMEILTARHNPLVCYLFLKL